MASKARQSVFGGFFGSSLKLVILPFFMRLCPSGGNDANDGPSHRVSNEEHPAVDHANGVEAQLVISVAIVELDHMRVQEHLGGRPEVEAVLLPVGFLLGVVPFEVHRSPRPYIFWYSLAFSRSPNADGLAREGGRRRV